MPCRKENIMRKYAMQKGKHNEKVCHALEVKMLSPTPIVKVTVWEKRSHPISMNRQKPLEKKIRLLER